METKSLSFEKMENYQGGITREQAEDVVCLGLGFSAGLVNPVFGLVVGAGCMIYHW